MGRRTRYEAAYRDAYRLADIDGCISTVCHERASEAADAAMRDYLMTRNERNAEYQRTYRWRKNFHKDFYEKYNKENGIEKITISMSSATLAILDAEASEMNLPLDSARNAVIGIMLGELGATQKRNHRKDDEKIHGVQIFIKSRREAGETDDAIQNGLDAIGIGMSIDEIMNYQFTTA